MDRREPEAAGVSPPGEPGDAGKTREAEDAQESFLRMMRHELRTPLQALSMLIELMRRESERGRPSASGSFSKAKVQLDRLSSLVSDLTEASSLPPTPAPEPSALPRRRDASGEGMGKILIVDDDTSILEALGELLRDRYEVLLASNGEEAVQQLSSVPIDLVVLDMLMPVLDGEGALREIRGRGLRVPVIVASARGDRLANYRELGADDFIQKPFEVGALEQKIDRLIASVA